MSAGEGHSCREMSSGGDGNDQELLLGGCGLVVVGEEENRNRSPRSTEEEEDDGELLCLVEPDKTEVLAGETEAEAGEEEGDGGAGGGGGGGGLSPPDQISPGPDEESLLTAAALLTESSRMTTAAPPPGAEVAPPTPHLSTVGGVTAPQYLLEEAEAALRDETALVASPANPASLAHHLARTPTRKRKSESSLDLKCQLPCKKLFPEDSPSSCSGKKKWTTAGSGGGVVSGCSSVEQSTKHQLTGNISISCKPASAPAAVRDGSTSLLTPDPPPPHLPLQASVWPSQMADWLAQFQKWSNAERVMAIDRLVETCEPSQVRHMMQLIEPQFQRDFISLLPKELALYVLSFLEPKDLLRAAQTCRNWRFLAEDNLLWREKCRAVGITRESTSSSSSGSRNRRHRSPSTPQSPWKVAFMRQHRIEMNWRVKPIRPPKTLKGHDEHVITCLQFSGNRIVSGSDDNTLKVWSATTGKLLKTLVGHTGGVWSSQMSGSTIISGSTDRTLKIWNAETGVCIHTLYGHTSTVRCMHLHEKKVVSGSRDATLRVWDVESGECLHVLVGHLAAVRCVQYNGKLVVSGAYDYMVKVWDPLREECLHTLQGHTNRVYSLQFDGIHVVSGSLDTSIRVWDVESGVCRHTLMGHQSLTSGMELDNNILVSGNADSTVKVWDIITGQCLQTLSGVNKHQSAVTCLQFNNRFVITSSDDGTVKLWDVKTGEFIRNLVTLESGGNGGVVWRIRANETKLVCAVGSRNNSEATKLLVLDFDVDTSKL